MYTIEPPALMEIQIVGRLHGQRTRNVFHYVYRNQDPIVDGNAVALAVAGEFVDQVYAALITMVSNEWTCEAVTAQWVQPIRYRMAHVVPETAVGVIVGNSLPAYCAAVISLYTELSGRPHQGRKYIAGVPSQYEENSNISDVYVDLLNDLGAMMTENLEVAGPATFEPTLTTPDSWPAVTEQAISDWVPRKILRVQRRREVGVGE